MKFTFVDSRPRQSGRSEDWQGERKLPRLFSAVEQLNGALQRGEVKVLAFARRREVVPEVLDPILSYHVTGRGQNNSWDTVTEATFDVSHYIGLYTTGQGEQTITIEIQPRWGIALLSYLLQYTTGIYLPPGSSAGAAASRNSAEWLLVLLWKSMFSQALRRSHMPKEYRARHTNDQVFRGRLEVARQLRENLADQSRFCCLHTPRTADILINQTIRHVFALLARERNYAGLLNDIAGYDERLASFGVQSCAVTPKQIESIRYTRMSNGYRELMQTSKAVIRRFGAGIAEGSGGTSFFVDIAEIWENYLQAILTAHLPPEYRVYSPNEAGGQWLVAGSKREIRPDIIIEKGGQPVAILDAKYKRYTTIGKHEDRGVSRADLYQMTTYLYHYGGLDAPLLGLFVSPGSAEGELEVMTSHTQHHLGVLNFDLARWDRTSKNDGPSAFNMPTLRDMEKRFVASVRKSLEERQMQVRFRHE